jgi:carboxyl-terminal processing protease
MPDIFVPIDTAYNNDYYAKLMRSSLINKYTLHFLKKNRRKILHEYPTVEVFSKKFQITNRISDALETFAEKEGISSDSRLFMQCKPLILRKIKSEIAKNLFDSEAYWIIENQENPMIKMALQSIESDVTEVIVKKD